MWTVDRGRLIRREIQEWRLMARQARIEIRGLLQLHGALPPASIRRHIAKLTRKAQVAEGHIRNLEHLLQEQRRTQEEQEAARRGPRA